MISGNCNRSPQYSAMGPSSQRHANNQHPFAAQHHQHPQLQFMAGGSVRVFPQMSRGFAMMSNTGQAYPTVMQCNMQQGFGGGYGYTVNSTPIFQNHNYHQQPPQPAQVIHHQPHQNYIQQPYIGSIPPPVRNKTPKSGFIDGIKNMVKGIIQPLNCDFYSDHHKYYNPKYRNNYMRPLATEKMAYTPQQPNPRVQSVKICPEVTVPLTKIPDRKQETITNVPKSSEATLHPKTTEIVAIFSSEDFPELPAPRRSRSITPAKTEKTPEQVVEVRKETVASKPLSTRTPMAHPTPKGTSFEILCTKTPCGRKPTFGGRLKVVPPPFTLNKSVRTCRSRGQESRSHNDCDTEEDSFVIFPNERPEDYILPPFGACRIPRQRQISECSDDSFVVFFAEDADSIVSIDSDLDDDEDEDDNDDLDSDEETSCEEDEDSVSESDEEADNGKDVVDSSFLGRNKTDRNKCAGSTLVCPQVDCTAGDHVQLDSGFDEKKVSFNPKPPVVHVMHTWNYAYRAARKGHWEDFARDRTRFQKRIERTSVHLNPILTPEHRERIYRSRFCEDAELDQEQVQEEQTTSTKLNTGSPQPTISHSDDHHRLPKLTKLPHCAKF